jgi:hypothetical protein
VFYNGKFIFATFRNLSIDIDQNIPPFCWKRLSCYNYDLESGTIISKHNNNYIFYRLEFDDADAENPKMVTFKDIKSDINKYKKYSFKYLDDYGDLVYLPRFNEFMSRRLKHDTKVYYYHSLTNFEQLNWKFPLKEDDCTYDHDFQLFHFGEKLIFTSMNYVHIANFKQEIKFEDWTLIFKVDPTNH